jgi:Tfp pilus assembly protein PilN
MINLLPTDYKTDVMYARMSTIVRKWVIIASGAIIGLCLILAGGLIYLQYSIQQEQKQLSLNEANLDAQNLSETQKQVEALSNNTKLVIDVLSQEILFSKLIKQIGSALPSGTTLDSLQISDVQGGIQLNAEARDFNAATQLQLNLQDPQNGVFAKADINNITCGQAGTDGASTAVNSDYPCSVVIQALFSDSKDYNLLSKGTKQ